MIFSDLKPLGCMKLSHSSEMQIVELLGRAVVATSDIQANYPIFKLDQSENGLLFRILHCK